VVIFFLAVMRVTGMVQQLAWCPNGHLLAALLCCRHVLLVFDLFHGGVLFETESRQHVIRDMVWSPDGQFLAVAGWNTQVYRSDTWELAFEMQTLDTVALAWGPCLAAAGQYGVTFSDPSREFLPVAHACSVAWTSRGLICCAAWDDNDAWGGVEIRQTTRIYNMGISSGLHGLGRVTHIALTVGDKWAAFGDGALNVGSTRPHWCYQIIESWHGQVAWSPDGSMLAFQTDADGWAVFSAARHCFWIAGSAAMAWSPLGDGCVAVQDKDRIVLRRAARWTPHLHSLLGQRDRLRALLIHLVLPQRLSP